MNGAEFFRGARIARGTLTYQQNMARAAARNITLTVFGPMVEWLARHLPERSLS